MISLASGTLSLELSEHPLRLTLRRRGRRLLRDATVWACAGTVHDQFIQLTEGVIAHEDRGDPERPSCR